MCLPAIDAIGKRPASLAELAERIAEPEFADVRAF